MTKLASQVQKQCQVLHHVTAGKHVKQRWSLEQAPVPGPVQVQVRAAQLQRRESMLPVRELMRRTRALAVAREGSAAHGQVEPVRHRRSGSVLFVMARTATHCGVRSMCEHQFTHPESWHATATVTVEVTLYLRKVNV